MSDITLTKVDEAFLHVDGERSTIQEMRDFFEFHVPGYQFMPAYRNKMWNGKIQLLDYRTQRIYAGLLPQIEKFAQDRDYTIEYDESLILSREFSAKEASDFIASLNLELIPRPYQIKAFVDAVRDRRTMFECPTGSGKSLIAYLLVRFYQQEGDKILIIVPTTSLVMQLYKDFSEYGKKDGWSSDDHVHYIMQGREKETDRNVVISTWQSLQRQPKAYFKQYTAVIGDEAHLFKSKSLIAIMTKLTDAPVRVGMTGTLDGALTHALVLAGLFGRVRKIITTDELIKAKHLAKFAVKAISLKYPEEDCKTIIRSKYHEEIEFLVGNKRRNAFITNLAVSLEGNTLVLFQYVEKHGSKLYDSIKKKAGNERKVFYIYGGTDVKIREEVRAIVETEKDAIIVSSNGVFSTGVNIKNLHNIISAHPGKSKVRVLQSIGRILRISDSKDIATLYDIVDDLSYKKRKNYAITHFLERHKYYVNEKFPVKIYNVELK